MSNFLLYFIILFYRTNNQLVDFLTANKGKNFVKSHGREVQRFIQKQGLDKTFIECDAHMWRTGDRHLPWGIQMDGGSDWVALSRPFVAYVATAVQDAHVQKDPLLEGLNTVFKHTLLPAEVSV
jgi:protein xylosyltransferase